MVDRTSSNGFKHHPERSRIDFRKTTELRIIMNHWDILSREAMGFPPLMIYKIEMTI